MAILNIPNQYLPGLELIATLEDELVEIIFNAISESKPSFQKKAIADQVCDRVKEIDSEIIQKIILALASIHELRQYTQYDNADLAKDLSESVISDLEGLSFEQQQKLQERLFRALNLFQNSLGFAAKARFLLSEYERLYLKGKILTDIRPIFQEETSEGVVGTLIIHLLKIDYTDKSGDKEFFIALDESDLKELKEQIKKAEEQKQSIKNLLEKTSIPSFTP